MDKKRLVFALVFLAVSTLLGYAIYRVFFAQPKPPEIAGPTGPAGMAGSFPTIGQGQTATGTPGGPGALPGRTDRPTAGPSAGPAGPDIGPVGAETGTSRVTRSLDAGVKSPAADDGGAVKFYNEQDGKFYRLLSDGTLAPMSDEVFFNVDKVTWSPNKDEGIIEYPDGANIYYDFKSRRQVTLPRHWEDFSFSPLGDQVAAKSVGIAPENRWLIAAKPDGSSIRLVEPMGDNADKVTVDWSPNKQIVALSRTGQALGADRQEVLFVGLNHENYRSFVVEGRGLETKWSGSGQKLLHSIHRAESDFKPELWIADATPDTVGGNRRLLNVNTWASKCAMADDRFVYCGVPERLEAGAGFAPAVANTTPDRLFKVDTVTGLKTEIPLTDIYTIDRITLSEDGSRLYFTDKNQVGLFKVDI